jgi:hypothetical protein
MLRHVGTLPDSYKAQLENMSLEEIAIEAARYRSDFKRCGTATALILRWTIANKIKKDERNAFLGLYSKAWDREKEARAQGRAERPAARPAMGSRGPIRRDRSNRFAAYC